MRNLRPDLFPRKKRKRVARIFRALGGAFAVLPVCLLLFLGVIGGCASDTSSLLPTVDPLANLPDNRQTKLLASNSVSPASGPIGTVITVQGAGEVFPKGYARFVFQGNGTAEVAVTEATGVIRVRVPPGAQSGSFGFTIAGRSTSRDTSPLHPSDSTQFVAYTVDTPGFIVTPAVTVVDPNSQIPGGAVRIPATS
ncbi:MAG: hypothetical protein HY303_01265 [Candidatus Wallbacteria bacterium]|nr:hypothetical protein [Candidatus Wallbacteria bacterium]